MMKLFGALVILVIMVLVLGAAQPRSHGSKEFNKLVKQVARLEKQLKSVKDRDDKRTLQLAKWTDEYHRDIHNSRNHRAKINSIK